MQNRVPSLIAYVWVVSVLTYPHLLAQDPFVNPDPKYLNLHLHLPEVAEGHTRHGFEFPRRTDGVPLTIELISGKEAKVGFYARALGGKFTKNEISQSDSGGRDRTKMFEYYIMSHVDVEAGESFDFPARKKFLEADTIWLHVDQLSQGGRNFCKVIIDAPNDVEIRFRVWQRAQELEQGMRSVRLSGEKKEIAFGGRRQEKRPEPGEP